MNILHFLKLKVTGFIGRIEELIDQIRSHVLDVVDVRLSEVARQMSDAVKENIDPLHFTPFLSLAKLMFIKSRNLLPGQDPLEETDLDEPEAQPEEEPTEVRERLARQQHIFQTVGARFRELEERNSMRLRARQTRAVGLPEFIDEISFLEEVTAFDLMHLMIQMLRMTREGRAYRVRVDDAKLLSMRIAEVFDYVLMRRGDPVYFSELVARKPAREEAVLSFLAVIYLVAQGRIIAEQSVPYGDIEIKMSDTARRAV